MKKTLKKKYRLHSAKNWKKTYSGNNVVKGYLRKYSVDKLFAIKELRVLGIEISEEYEHQLQKSVESNKQQRLSAKKKQEDELNTLCVYESDEFFAMIIGYTSGGLPYGLTHKEMKDIKSKTEIE